MNRKRDLDVDGAIRLHSVEPPYWWRGMKQELMLTLCGDNLCDCSVSMDSPCVSIIKMKSGDDGKYLFVWVGISNDAPSKFSLILKRGGEVVRYDYRLLDRETGSAGRQGFNASDIIYLIFPDRFARGDDDDCTTRTSRDTVIDRTLPNNRHGGNIQGIIDRIPYLCDLGVTTLWLTPVVEDDMPQCSYHHYSCTNMYKIDPRFGTLDKYIEFVTKARDSGLKVIMDMVLNHVGSRHKWFSEPPLSNWFHDDDVSGMTTNHTGACYVDPHVSQFDKRVTPKCKFDVMMPDLNHEGSDALADYMIINTLWWIEATGIRLDTMFYVDPAYLSRWSRAIMNEYPLFNIVGEAWLRTPLGVSYWQGRRPGVQGDVGYDSGVPCVFDFPLKDAVDKLLFKERYAKESEVLPIYDVLCQDSLYKQPDDLIVFLDNHDTDRIFSTILASVSNSSLINSDAISMFKLCMALMMTCRGIPQIYYGTELLNTGTKVKMPGDLFPMDGFIRGDFDYFDTVPDVTTLDKARSDAYHYVRTLIRWRKSSRCLQSGDYIHWNPSMNSSVYCYARRTDDETFLILLNFSPERKSVDWVLFEEIWPVCPKEGSRMFDFLTNVPLDVVVGGPRSAIINLEPRHVHVIKLK